MQDFLFITMLVSTLLMTGIIYFVQWVHYPLFKKVGEQSFLEYEQLHTRWITPLVAPLMVIELGSSIFFWWENKSEGWLMISIILLGIIWASTFFLQVPLHQKLSKTREVDLMVRLVKSNWIRTFAWTGRAGILIYLLAEKI